MKGLEKSIELLGFGFKSNSDTSPEFLTFVQTFINEFTEALKERGCTNFKISKEHLNITGFFTSSTGQVYYFFYAINTDKHWFDGTIIYRTARHYKDYTGGPNQFVRVTPDLVSRMNIK